MQSKTASEKITVNTIYNDNKHSGYCVLVFVLFFWIYLLCNGFEPEDRVIRAIYTRKNKTRLK